MRPKLVTPTVWRPQASGARAPVSGEYQVEGSGEYVKASVLAPRDLAAAGLVARDLVAPSAEDSAEAEETRGVGLSWEYLAKSCKVPLELSLRVISEAATALAERVLRNPDAAPIAVCARNLMLRDDGTAFWLCDPEARRAQPEAYRAPDDAGSRSASTEVFGLGVMLLESFERACERPGRFDPAVAPTPTVVPAGLRALALRARHGLAEARPDVTAFARELVTAAAGRIAPRQALAELVRLGFAFQADRPTPVMSGPDVANAAALPRALAAPSPEGAAAAGDVANEEVVLDDTDLLSLPPPAALTEPAAPTEIAALDVGVETEPIEALRVNESSGDHESSDGAEASIAGVELGAAVRTIDEPRSSSRGRSVWLTSSAFVVGAMLAALGAYALGLWKPPALVQDAARAQWQTLLDHWEPIPDVQRAAFEAHEPPRDLSSRAATSSDPTTGPSAELPREPTAIEPAATGGPAATGEPAATGSAALEQAKPGPASVKPKARVRPKPTPTEDDDLDSIFGRRH